MGDYEKEQQRLRKLLEEVLTDEESVNIEYDDESDENEVDRAQFSDHDSESEQDISENEVEESFNSSALSFIGKDGTTYWKKYPQQPKTVRTRKENLILRLPGPTAATKSLKQPIDIWNYFINEEIVNIIVCSTNKYIDSIKHRFSLARDASQTNDIEICALIGLIGLTHTNRTNCEDMWKINGYGIETFRLTMFVQRFKFLLRHIRFDDKSTRQERSQTDKLAAIREVFQIFQISCQNGYHLSAYVTNEMLAAFRGRCSFKQYIPSKPNKYGVKILALCDAKMFYTSKLEVYLGTQPEGPYKVSNKPTDVVLRLCENISGSGRNVTMDNWFMSVPLVRQMMAENMLTVIGTLRKNKRELPIEFSKPDKRPQYSSMFGFTKDYTRVSYIPKKGKNVLLISSFHHHDDIDPATGDSYKPVIVTEYNKTKGGVDVVYKLCASYDCGRNTRRWPMILFYTMLNIAGINSQIIFNVNNPDTKLLRRNYLREIVNGLIFPHLQIRASMTNLPRALRVRLQEFCNITPSQNQENVTPGRCTYCDWKKNRKTRFFCFKCSKHMCLEHITCICQTCKENAFQNE